MLVLDFFTSILILFIDIPRLFIGDEDWIIIRDTAIIIGFLLLYIGFRKGDNPRDFWFELPDEDKEDDKDSGGNPLLFLKLKNKNKKN